ncbi:hypothetical protein Y032_1006g3372 [Ancylostoma ceylanicum]|uniref:Secreted protein n=1 Tax=Ancylostoma ceylanicum TaxID=53326 RepID=A0A016W7S7_9BILA|nr:hypothetical protein Y032_1006g3372 [Ancylostoma ceylanicum]
MFISGWLLGAPLAMTQAVDRYSATCLLKRCQQYATRQDMRCGCRPLRNVHTVCLYELQTVDKGWDRSWALWLSAAPGEAAGNHDISAFICASTQQARCLGASDSQSARARPPLVRDRLELTIYTICTLSAK